MSEENKAIVKRYRAIHNSGNLAELDQIVAHDLISHSALPGLPPGLQGGKMAHQGFLMAFPDTKTKTEDLIAEGDKVFERYTASGTHQGDFMGMPATHKSYSIEAMVEYRIADGKIVEMWGLNDGTALMQQLGATQGQPK
jgi:steroid delta-isomerase-like uncharacterized protein